MHPGCAAPRALFCVLYVPPGHDPFDCFEDPPVPLSRVLCCVDPEHGFNFNLPWEVFRGAFGSSKNGNATPLLGFRTSCSVAHLVRGFSHRLSAQTSSDWVVARCFAVQFPPRVRAGASVDGRFDALAFRLAENLGEREVGVVGTTLKAKDSREDFEVHLSELDVVNRVEGPRHTPVQQGLSHLGLPNADLQDEQDGHHIV